MGKLTKIEQVRMLRDDAKERAMPDLFIIYGWWLIRLHAEEIERMLTMCRGRIGRWQ